MGNPQVGLALLLSDVDPGIAEHLFKMIPDVLPELVLALIDSLPGDFIAPAHDPWSGQSTLSSGFGSSPSCSIKRFAPQCGHFG
jgi:hypothetical protein